jgi:hypothetical protein
MEKGLVKRQLNLEAKLSNIAYQIETEKMIQSIFV